MRPQEIIAKKRDGGELSDAEIRAFIDGVCDKSWADYQISALIMAMVIRGLSLAEQDAITDAMLNSGEVLDFSSINKPKGDKHSTGGVGDKTSLVIAPIVAACGVAVPMISGRGLGHTGGTLDKLEAIPGYNVKLTTEEFHNVIEKCGFAMTGQTAEIAPADKKIYALRDATATVPCIPLIVASIMSKKLAEGLDALILDVKTGSGAFMQTLEDSTALAEALVLTGRKFGVRTEAVISDMSQPLGRYVGNAVEVYECIQILKGESDDSWADTKELSVELSARLLVLAGVSESVEAARQVATSKLTDGTAFEKFRENVELQGGDLAVCDDPELLIDRDLFRVEIKATGDGFVTAIDTLAIGNAVCEIGGGRIRADDKVDHAVGYESLSRIGDKISKAEPAGLLHCRSLEQAAFVESQLANAYVIGNTPQTRTPIISQVISSPKPK
ncbi:MAG: thymidine phosphorylase [Acidobacteria bacterium]|nr:thymidine phosphorylase [Acidobacteriota bacterium]